VNIALFLSSTLKTYFGVWAGLCQTSAVIPLCFLRCPEALFQPSLLGMEQQGVSELVYVFTPRAHTLFLYEFNSAKRYNAINKCDIDIRKVPCRCPARHPKALIRVAGPLQQHHHQRRHDNVPRVPRTTGAGRAALGPPHYEDQGKRAEGQRPQRVLRRKHLSELVAVQGDVDIGGRMA
jgi:hypothetical protein